MDIKFVILSITVALALLSPVNNLNACEDSSSMVQEDYPKVSGWSRSMKSQQDKMHIEAAKTMDATMQLQKAKYFSKSKSPFCLLYFEAVINNSNAQSIIRDEAILTSSTVFAKSIQTYRNQRFSQIDRITQEYLKCLHFMVNNKKTLESQRILALVMLIMYYLPEQDKIFPDPKKCEESCLSALNCKLEPPLKATILNQLAVLYHNKHLGEGQEGLNSAFTCYDSIDQDETMPMEDRLSSRLNKVKILGDGYYCEETRKDRMALIQSILNHADASPSLKKQARLYSVDELLQEFNYLKDMFVKKRPGELEEVINELGRLKQDVSFLDDHQIQLLNVRIITLLIDLKYLYNLDLKILNINNDYLPNLLKELIGQASPPCMDLWADTVLQVLRLMPVAMNAELKFLNKKKISELIDKALQHNAVSQNIKNTIKGLKACFVPEGLLTTTSKKDTLLELQDHLMDKSIPQYVKINVLEKLAKHTHKRFPNYNKAIENTIGYLKKALNEETDPLILVQIKFILYTYFQAYKECSLTTEEVSQYVKDLSSDDTPEEFRIYITTDDDFDEEEDLKPEVENEFTLGTTSTTTPTTTTSTIETTSTTCTTTTAPAPVVTQDTNSQQNRDLLRAQLLLDRLNALRGKVTQQEVANMLRRLDYTFQPTAENGLTIHLGHKGRNNKKGTPGRLDGGRKNDLAKILQDAIQKAKLQ